MKLIVNEKKFVEKEILNKTNIKLKPFDVISLLAKYGVAVKFKKSNEILSLEKDIDSEKKLKYGEKKSAKEKINKEYETINKETKEFIDSVMTKGVKGYKLTLWENTIDKQIKQAHKYPLRQVESVNITESEFNIIRKIEDRVSSRLMFVILCHSKLNYLHNKNSNGWVSCSHNRLFKDARMNEDFYRSELKMKYLLDNEYIRTGKNNRNCSVQPTFADFELENNTKEIIYSIDNFDELAYLYMFLCGDENIIQCKKCGVFIKQNRSKNREYCRECFENNPYYEKVETKTIKCVDCGCELEVISKASKTIRCDECQKLYEYTPIEEKVIQCVDCGCDVVIYPKDNKSERCEKCQLSVDRSIKKLNKYKRYINNGRVVTDGKSFFLLSEKTTQAILDGYHNICILDESDDKIPKPYTNRMYIRRDNRFENNTYYFGTLQIGYCMKINDEFILNRIEAYPMLQYNEFTDDYPTIYGLRNEENQQID